MKNLKKKVTQSYIDFNWFKPIHYKQVFLVPKKNISGWDKKGNEGYIHGLNHNLTTNGGKIAVFRVSVKDRAGYMLFDGYDELIDSFEIEEK